MNTSIPHSISMNISNTSTTWSMGTLKTTKVVNNLHGTVNDKYTIVFMTRT